MPVTGFGCLLMQTKDRGSGFHFPDFHLLYQVHLTINQNLVLFFDDIVDRSGLLVERLDKIFEFEYFRLFLLWIRALEY
jgi:hypothetical protein